MIVALVNGVFPIEGCLESLHRSCPEAEVIVANRCGEEAGILVKQKYPRVDVFEASSHLTIPQLRAMAFLRSSGDVVAVLEDHCIVDSDWGPRLIAAHKGEYPVIGGSVENAACKRLVDWAAFFCEYSQAMKPIPEGKVNAVPGNNVSYKRWVLERFSKEMEAGGWDFILHERMKASGIPLYSIPSITVHHQMSGSLKWFISQKFHFARSFAGTRFAGPLWGRRALYGAGAAFLPIIMARRIFACVWRKETHRQELLLSGPILILLLLSWGLGEATGYIFGPGSSSAKVS